MTEPPTYTLSATVLDAPDAHELAAFYRRLLGWDVVADEPGWVELRPAGGGPGLSFQDEPEHVPPVWPAGPAGPAGSGHQRMQLHLDLRVDDLDAAGDHARACGATLAAHQSQAGVRVWVDPAGHPFCLFLPGAWT